MVTQSRPTALPLPVHSRPPRLSFALLLVTASLMLPVACTRRSAETDQAPDVHAELVELSPDPPTVGETDLVLRLTDAGGSPLSGASVSLKADMTHAGMTPVFSNAVDEGEGRYRTTFEWTMAGDWILTVSGTLADGRSFSSELQVSVSTGGG